ncbi:MAG: LysR family transcriptional regulator [Proteobacteria bacterium]|nr:LysR family transcriptional regulator [Pseudomonadota bacterium]
MKQDYTITRGAFDGVEAFVRVAEMRSFRQAAARLGLTPSAVSQAVRALEARLGVALFTRTTRSVGLTEAGERFLAQARPALEEVIAASRAAHGLGARPSGLLRLAVPRGVVPLVLQPVLASFCAAYPDVVLEIAASEQLVDLAKDGFDAGIRFGELVAADMVAVRLTPPIRLIVVGSPAYFARCGEPRAPGDLTNHACVRQRLSDGSLAHWRLRGTGGPLDLAVSGPLIVNDVPTMLAAALSGVALAQVPAPAAAQHLAKGELKEVLAEHALSSQGVFLYFPSLKQVMPKLRAFIDHVKAHTAAVAPKSQAKARAANGRRSR